MLELCHCTAGIFIAAVKHTQTHNCLLGCGSQVKARTSWNTFFSAASATSKQRGKTNQCAMLESITEQDNCAMVGYKLYLSLAITIDLLALSALE